MKNLYLKLFLLLLIMMPIISCSDDESDKAAPTQETQVYLTDSEKNLDQRFYGIWKNLSHLYFRDPDYAPHFYHSFSSNGKYTKWSSVVSQYNDEGEWWIQDTVIFIDEINSDYIQVYSYSFQSNNELRLIGISRENRTGVRDTIILKK